MFLLTTVITLVTGTIFLMWLGEQITERGIGNGISLIIFAGIAAGLPSAIGGTLELVRTGAMHFLVALGIFVAAIVVTGFRCIRGARAAQDIGELREASGWAKGLWGSEFSSSVET